MNKFRLLPLLITLSVTFILLSCTTGETPIRALLVTGGGWHDYNTQEQLLIEGVNERIGEQIEWTVIHEGNGEPDHHVTLFEQENWAEGYDVVVHNTGFGRVTDPVYVENMVRNHQGTPAVVIHASVHSYRYAEPADPWFEFLGFQSMYHEAERTFEIENIARDHPVMAGFPESLQMPSDEIYVVEQIWGDIVPLVRAYGEDTGLYHTVAWTHEYNGTNVFATTLGHNNATFEEVHYLDLVANGILWATGRL